MTSLRVCCSVHQILWWRTLDSNRLGNTIGMSFDMVISTTNTTIITTGSAEYRKTIFDVSISAVTTIFDVIIFDAIVVTCGASHAKESSRRYEVDCVAA